MRICPARKWRWSGDSAQCKTKGAKNMRLIDADKLIQDGWRLERHGKSGEVLSCMSIADVPTAKGVLCPPVKIGQELWDIHYNKPRKWEVCYIGYNGKEWFIDLRYFKNKNGFVTIQIESRYLNRLYFLTKEEAEKALEEQKEARN